MSYGSECRALNKVDTRRMQAAEMRMIKMMHGMTLRDGIPKILGQIGSVQMDPGQMNPRADGSRTIGSPDKWIPGQTGKMAY